MDVNMNLGYYRDKNNEIAGGYIHKLKGFWKGTVSVYFDKHFEVIDAEQIIMNHRGQTVERQVVKNGPIWNEVARRVAIHAPLKRPNNY